MMVFYAAVGLILNICILVHYSIKLNRFDKGIHGVLAGMSACSAIMFLAALVMFGVRNG